MPPKRLKWIFKVFLASASLLILKFLAQRKLPYLLDPAVLSEPRGKKNGLRDLLKSYTNSTFNKVSRHLRHSYTSKIEIGETASAEILTSNSGEIIENIYGSGCPFNPHKPTLHRLFYNWMHLDHYYNLSSFLCRGSLIGSLRNADMIPYDRDVDVCVTSESYPKIRAIRSRKPFNYRSSRIHLAVQDNFYNDDVTNRIRVDCRGRKVNYMRDPCSFETPGARLISRGVYVDVFVFREHGRNLRDHEYEKEVSRTDVFPLKFCAFMGLKAKCPRNEMALLLAYYEPDVLTNPHYTCHNKTWVAMSEEATKQFKIWFKIYHKRHG